MEYFLKGLLIGFSITSVIGPISILIVRQTIVDGYKSGFVASLGASTADAFYGAVAAYGLTMISGFLIEQQFFLRIFGGAFLLYLGFKTIFSKMPQKADIAISKKNLWKNYFTVAALTISNPLTIILFLSVFAGLDFSQEANFSPFLTTLGIGVGSVLAYVVLIAMVLVLKKKASDKALEIMHMLSGLMIVAFAIYAIAGAFNLQQFIS